MCLGKVINSLFDMSCKTMRKTKKLHFFNWPTQYFICNYYSNIHPGYSISKDHPIQDIQSNNGSRIDGKRHQGWEFSGNTRKSGFFQRFPGFPEWVFPIWERKKIFFSENDPPQFILSTLKCNSATPKALKLHLLFFLFRPFSSLRHALGASQNSWLISKHQ
jgi:hypothetical protein